MVFLREHHEAVEYDLLTLGLDIRDLYRGRSSLTWRRLAAILKSLPASSASIGRRLEWRENQWVLRDIFDVLAGANWQRAGDDRAPRPEPYPRPGDDGDRADDARTQQQALAARERLRKQQKREA